MRTIRVGSFLSAIGGGAAFGTTTAALSGASPAPLVALGLVFAALVGLMKTTTA